MVGVAVAVGIEGVIICSVVAGGSSALATAVDVSTGAAVAADNNDAVGAVVPPLLTKDKDAYVSTLVSFKGACNGAFADRSLCAAATALPPSRCAPPPNFALPPLRRRQEAAEITLLRCAAAGAATTLPPSH